MLATHNMELARMSDVTLALKDGRIDGTKNASASANANANANANAGAADVQTAAAGS